MTLGEAIKHCEEKACGSSECALEHKQLAEWLKELQALRKNKIYREKIIKTIEERAIEYTYKKWSFEFADIVVDSYKRGAIEQKAIDDAELLKLKASWEKETQINHNDEANYKQGYHDAIEKACEWITEHIDIPYKGKLIDNVSLASDYIEWCEKRLEIAKEIADTFKQAMEEQL